MIRCKRRVVRETAEIHGPSGKPFVVKLTEGGKTVQIKIKGTRTWFVIPIKQLWTVGAWNRAAEIRREKKARREAAKAARS